MTVQDLPHLNAILNFTALVLLISGYVSICQKRKQRHRNLMVAAMIVSTIFLISYLTYHYHHGHKVFPNIGWIKTLYLAILIPHIILAIGMLPLILVTFYFALTEQWNRHKKIARVSFPIWVFVSLSGVLIYILLTLFYW